MRKVLLLILSLIAYSGTAQHKPAYQLFSKDGKVIAYTDMIKQLEKVDVVLFGELHNNSIIHWLQLQVTKDLHTKRPQMSLGFEMFEADDQIVINEYLKGWIDEKQLMKEAKMWDNYKTDYKPLLDFAKAQQLPVIASNIPRRYASMVYRRGINQLDSLPTEAKAWIAPLPFAIDLELPGYKNMISSMGGHGSSHSAENMARSQASKDATMAHFMLKYKQGLLIHYHGTYHSQNFEGIVWYLKKQSPELKIVTIHSVEQDQLDKLQPEHLNSADFILCVPSDMAKSY